MTFLWRIGRFIKLYILHFLAKKGHANKKRTQNKKNIFLAGLSKTF